MPGFDAIYKQTVTLFNRIRDAYTEDVVWYPTVLHGVHLVVDKSSAWGMQGGRETDNVRLHVRYAVSGDSVLVGGKPWHEPKAWRKLAAPETAITFGYGDDDFDFFIEGEFTDIPGPISDDQFKNGFYNYMNANYDNVFAITSVSKYNLIPHFEIMAR